MPRFSFGGNLKILALYILGAQNIKDHLSSIKSLDLVAIQSSTTNLRKSENLKMIKESRWPNFFAGPQNLDRGT